MNLRQQLRETSLCMLAVALIELVFYALSSETFSAYIYIKSVFEVYAAPVYPGWALIYPVPIFLAILGAITALGRVRNRLLRISGIFLSTLAWATLGFYTIVQYYNG